MDGAQAFLPLGLGVGLQAAREGGNDLGPAQPRATRPAHGQNEGPAKTGVVVGVELLQGGKFFGAAVGQARAGLLRGGLGRQVVGHHGFARQFGVGADEVELGLQRCGIHHLRADILQLRQRNKRPLRQCGAHDPGGMFVHATQQVHGVVQRGGVELIQSQGGGGHGAINGWVAAQWRAMSAGR